MSVVIRTNPEFKKFYYEFFPAVYNLIKKYTGESELARDLTQEAFVKMYECKEEFDTFENAKAFLYTVVRHLYYNHCKHQKVQDKLRLFVHENEEEQDNYLKEVTFQETVRILYQSIDRLSPQSRKIILLNLQGKNNQEVAEELHISVNTVKSLKKSAYQTLRKMIGDDYVWLLIFLTLRS